MGCDMSARPRCLLQDALDRIEACPGEACPLWENGGAVVEGGCAIERLGLPTSLDLRRRPDLAAWLLGIRNGLDRGHDEPPGMFGLLSRPRA